MNSAPSLTLPTRRIFSNRSVLLTGALMMFCAFSLRAEEAPTITVSKGDRIGITIAGLGGGEGAAATKTLQNDLLNSGYFTISPNSGYVVKGTASSGSLQGQVTDHSGGTVFSKSFVGGRAAGSRSF